MKDMICHVNLAIFSVHNAMFVVFKIDLKIQGKLKKYL